jgi:hypothetical protein
MDEGIAPNAEAPPGSAREPAGRPAVARSMLVIGGSIAALVVIAIVVVLAAPRGPATYPPNTPEAAFQEFYAAYEIGDLDAAYALFSTDVKAEVSLATYRRSELDYAWQRDQDRRIVLDRVDQSEGRAVLHLRVDEFSPGGLGGNRSSYDRSIRLVQEGEAWLIDEALFGIQIGPLHEPAF